MHKELIITTTPQETKLAILENDELVEFTIERRRAEAVVGNIYKGKVTKVLPGMQSAFVDIGLERDAFLYVSDFFEDAEEYDKIVSTAEEEVVASLQESGGARQPQPPAAPPTVPLAEKEPEVEPPPAPQPVSGTELLEGEVRRRPSTVSEGGASVEGAPPPEQREGGRRDRDRDRGDRDRGDRRDRGRDRGRDRRGKTPKIPSFEARTYEPREESGGGGSGGGGSSYSPLEVIPGEVLSKYRNRPPSPAESEKPEVSTSAVENETQNAAEEERTPSPQPPAEESRESTPQDEEPKPNVRMTDQSDNAFMAHRPQQRRGRRRGGGAPGGGGDRGERSERTNSSPKSEESRSNGHNPKSGLIAELLREGQEILVQVSKEPLGKKGARITSHIALPGRYLVYMPTVDHVGVSRKISSDEERQRLKRIINEHRGGLPGGFIVRTAAEGRSESEFINDIRFLGNLWADIRVRSEKKAAPAMIHSDLNLVQRTLRDQLTEEFRAIRIDNEQEFATVLDFVNKFQPALVNRVKLHVKDTPIFEEFGLNAEIDKALKSKVWLKSGGYIVINQTEALVAIDINTGKYVGKSNRLEDTITRTNVDAVHEIVRQIRLRNLGGIIVVDFIDMEERKNRQKVMAALEEELRLDRVPSKILQFNDFGLVAITRKRTQPSLERTVCAPCAHCSGSGWVKSPETVCYEIQSELRKMAHLLEGKEVTVRVNPEVAKVLKGGEFVSLIDIEEWLKKDIVVKSDALLHEEHFDIF
ncbi:MAG TPA: Rne/Rng family ribonuclease [Terriglobia bacterium]|nr:Rne/Rng family ribonuclease [Terriglobia bacterium]